MKPAPFDYYAPESIREALELLREHAPNARVLAGGQSLIAQLNGRDRRRLKAPSAISSAIDDALRDFHVRVNELPATPERIVEWIRRGGNN
jgi:hypothetical protein